MATCDDQSLLLGADSYGNAGGLLDEAPQSQTDPEKEEIQVDKTKSKDFILNDDDNWCMSSFDGFRGNDSIIFICYIILLTGSLANSACLALSRYESNNVFLPAVSLGPGANLRPDSGLTSWACEGSLVFMVITLYFSFAMLSVKWIARLNDNLKFLRLELGVNTVGVLLLVVTIALRAVVFITWCDVVMDSHICKERKSVCPPHWEEVKSCTSGLTYISMNYNYHLEPAFYYMAASLGGSFLLFTIWVALTVLVIGKYSYRRQKEAMFLEHCYGHGYSPETVVFSYFGDIRAEMIAATERRNEAGIHEDVSDIQGEWDQYTASAMGNINY